MSAEPKIWPEELTQGFSKIWPSDLVFDLKWLIFKLIWDFINANILTKFHEYRNENMASRMYTRKKVENEQGTTDRKTTIAHSKHFLLRWAKNADNKHFIFSSQCSQMSPTG